MNNEKTYVGTLHRCFPDSLSIDPLWLCLLNLVYTTRLGFTTPVLGSQELVVTEKLRMPGPDRSETFYLNAVSHNNPVVGFEDVEF